MTRGEFWNWKGQLAYQSFLGGGYLSKVGSETVVWPANFQLSLFVFVGSICYQTVSAVRLCSVFHILTPTTLSAVSAPLPTPTHFSLHWWLLFAPLYIFRRVWILREVATSFLISVCLSASPCGKPRFAQHDYLRFEYFFFKFTYEKCVKIWKG
jgi:hypothetical protein